MVSFGERLAIIFPSIFFIILFLINIVKTISLFHKLSKKAINIDEGEWVSIASSHIMSSIFIEYIILSITNGLSLIFVLQQQEFGAVTIVAGVISSLIGLVYTNFEAEFWEIKEEEDQKLKSQFLFSILFSISVAYIGYFWFHESPYTFPFLSGFETSWVAFLLFFVVGLIVDWKITDKLLP